MVPTAGDEHEVEGRIDRECRIDLALCFRKPHFIEVLIGQVGVVKRIGRIEFHGLLECSLGAAIVAPLAFCQAHPVPERRVARRDFQGTLEIRQRAYSIVFNEQAVLGARFQCGRVVGIVRKRLFDTGARFVSIVEQHCKLRAGRWEERIVRISPFRLLDRFDRCADIGAKARGPGRSEGAIGTCCLRRRLLDPVRVGESACEIAAEGRDGAAVGIEPGGCLFEQLCRIAVAVFRTGNQRFDEIGARGLRSIEAEASSLLKGGCGLGSPVEPQLDFGECQPIFGRARRFRPGFDPFALIAHVAHLKRG